MRAPLGARFLAVVMRLAQGLYVRRVKAAPLVAFMRHDVIANRSKRLGQAARGACKHDIGRRHAEHAKITQAVHAMRMRGEVLGAQLLPGVVIASLCTTGLASAPRDGLRNDDTARQ
ncbi:hypothetical protein J2794_003588 [Paraburkholderia terricola]|uniref:hypothetical protein n=1 Tax=Paraburkholderia terricola TaxID=169427 RepID=UPI0028560072|nr:hypothetical protein [Paraburkholderia terricola]MDR6447472.1 hypothetical protein [Paraburkholderia terricola]